MCVKFDTVGISIIACCNRLNVIGAKHVPEEEVCELLSKFTAFVIEKFACGGCAELNIDCLGRVACYQSAWHKKLLEDLCQLNLDISYGIAPPKEDVFHKLSSWIMASWVGDDLYKCMAARH